MYHMLEKNATFSGGKLLQNAAKCFIVLNPVLSLITKYVLQNFNYLWNTKQLTTMEVTCILSFDSHFLLTRTFF